MSTFVPAVKKASYPPARWIASRLIAKVMRVDFAASSRMLSKMSQVQGLLMALSGRIASPWRLGAQGSYVAGRGHFPLSADQSYARTR